MRVTFDGEECVYEGPRVFLDGTEVLFEYDPIDGWANKSGLIVGPVRPGTTWDEARDDINSHPASRKPDWLIDLQATYGPGKFSYTMASVVENGQPAGGHLIVCLTSPGSTDAGFFGDLVSIAGG